MQADPEELREHFAALNDEALLEIDRDDLAGQAANYYDRELKVRRLKSRPKGSPAREALGDSQTVADFNPGEEPAWLPEAINVVSFGDATGDAIPGGAQQARVVLKKAAIPAYITVENPQDSSGRAGILYNVMVPSEHLLRAKSVLDKEIFNVLLETEHRTHFESMPVEAFEALEEDTLVAGMLDRVERLRRAYREEVARRQRSGH